jgi:hypothetical protein
MRTAAAQRAPRDKTWFECALCALRAHAAPAGTQAGAREVARLLANPDDVARLDTIRCACSVAQPLWLFTLTLRKRLAARTRRRGGLLPRALCRARWARRWRRR